MPSPNDGLLISRHGYPKRIRDRAKRLSDLTHFRLQLALNHYERLFLLEPDSEIQKILNNMQSMLRTLSFILSFRLFAFFVCTCLWQNLGLAFSVWEHPAAFSTI